MPGVRSMAAMFYTSLKEFSYCFDRVAARLSGSLRYYYSTLEWGVNPRYVNGGESQ